MSKFIICPKCEDEIFSLNYSCHKTVNWGGTAYFKELPKEQLLAHEHDYCTDEYPECTEDNEAEYSCPDCGEVLFDNEKDATEFWKKNAKEEEK